jgi:hypothetical protein
MLIEETKEQEDGEDREEQISRKFSLGRTVTY